MTLTGHAKVERRDGLVEITPLSTVARAWLSERAEVGRSQWVGGYTLVVELRFAEALVTAMEEAL